VSLDDVFHELTEAAKHAETARELIDEDSSLRHELAAAERWTQQARESVAEELEDGL